MKIINYLSLFEVPEIVLILKTNYCSNYWDIKKNGSAMEQELFYI